MKHILFAAVLVALAVMPAYSQTSRAARAEADSATTGARTGVRFVICSPSGAQLPSPLYVKQGKIYKVVRLGSRTPGIRLRPEGQTFDFLDHDPGAASEGNGRKPAAAQAAEEVKPIFSVPVPGGGSSKMLGILMPVASADKKSVDPAKTRCMYLNEKDFPSKGVHIINLSPYPLQMLTSAKGDFSDQQKAMIRPYSRSEGIGAKNSWSFTGMNDGEAVSFVLSAKMQDGKDYTRIKAARFVISHKQSQITLIVKDPNAETGGVKLMTLQLTEGR